MEEPMQQFMSDIKPYLEAIYLLTGIVLVIIAAYGLKQVRLLKLDIKGRSERSAKEKSIEAASEYLNSYVPLFNAYYHEYKQLELPSYDGPIGDFSIKSISKEDLINAKKRFGLDGWLAAVNKLESIAAMYTKGVADEKVGFEIIGRSFCGNVAGVYDLISICHSDIACPYFHNVVRLYDIWAPRLSKQELEASRKQIELQMSKIPETGFSPLNPLDN
jgi:hypothetical protein